MSDSIDVNGKVINELPQELEDFAIGCLLSSAEFLNKEVEFSELDVSAKILEKIKILELIIKAKYSIDNEQRDLEGTITKYKNDFSQFLWITINQKELNIKDKSTIINVDYLMNVDEGKYLRNTNRRVLYNNGNRDIITFEPVELTTDKMIEIGEKYRKEKSHVL